ncbi:CHASE2 domain-containing sensor protein [Catenuloplanes nepalensis]|uniref:CHASE2 domain-containing sensor protein n=1 Tax=Catenuloplanes nepalensis TaxID=587533 RepID=A0ABT9N5Q0_9ACTN|nr:hypothetical protein [Catenuloplanes nepalensis]MDP9799018.1 CHASE2 domain-containing sensor protein [Catenuloplanes nepalensis]
MNWIRQARRGAADEFGRRMWRWFLAAEITKRLVFPVTMIALLTVALWLAVRFSAVWLPRLATLALATAALTAAGWVLYIGTTIHRRRRWRPAPHPAVPVVLGLLSVGMGILYWLRVA